MKICGIKITHDAAVALIEDGKLIFSVELEKIANGKRHAKLESREQLWSILATFGYRKEDIDVFVLDGWRPPKDGSDDKSCVTLDGEKLYVNNYQNRLLGLTEEMAFNGTSNTFGSYRSYTHTYTHLCATYCSSPFAKAQESSFVLFFDGGSKPVLYYFDAQAKKFIFLKELLEFGGDIYAEVSSRFEPYTDMRRFSNGKWNVNLHFVGKVMAYIALGEKKRELMDKCYEIYHRLSQENSIANDWKQNRVFADAYESYCKGKYADVDALTSFHHFIQEILSERVVKAARESGFSCDNICFAGGNLLNIKWNSEIRRSQQFKNVYAPPFINDSGSAIGAACAEWCACSGQMHVEWNTYSGEPLIQNATLEGWKARKCSLKELAGILADAGEPIVMVSGRSELGPRALGARSILADPRNRRMKEVLNRIKKREGYRPVAPICIEEDAPKYFVPGTPDKYMLFEHTLTPEASRIPAIAHLDGTARLQTVAREDNAVVYELLTHFKEKSGVSVLCNTSANFLGSGFFPDILSVQQWGGCNYIWSEGVLYEKTEKVLFPELH